MSSGDTTKELSNKEELAHEETRLSHLVLSKLLTLTTIISFLWSGLTINILQLINYIFVRQFDFPLFTQINYYLMYSAWAQIVTLFDWFFKSEIKVYHARREQEDEIFAEHSIFLANHGYELDWVAAWLTTDKFGHLASCKAMIKSDLKYVPIVGWSWAMSDQLFLDRNWEKDRHKFGNSMDMLLKYQPMVATFFCEGTRFTMDKFEACQRFAAERNLEAPRHHLIPRTKGFVTVMNHIRRRQKADPNLKVCIYNTQVAFEEAGALSIADVIKRNLRPKGHMYFERIDLEEIPGDDEGCARWLHDLFLKKDTLQDYFNANNCFPGHLDRRFVDYKPRLATISNWIFWSLYTLIPLVYFVLGLHARYGTFLVSIVVSAFFLLSYAYLSFIMYQADVGRDQKQTSTKKAN